MKEWAYAGVTIALDHGDDLRATSPADPGSCRSVFIALVVVSYTSRPVAARAAASDGISLMPDTLELGRLILPALRAGAGRLVSPTRPAPSPTRSIWASAGSSSSAATRRASAASPPISCAAPSAPLLLASDLERGAGQQVEGLTEFPPPLALAAMGDPERGALGRRGDRAGGPRGRDQLGLRARRRPRRAAGEPDRADPRLRPAIPTGWPPWCATGSRAARAPARSPAPSTIPGTAAPLVDSHITLPSVDASSESLPHDRPGAVRGRGGERRRRDDDGARRVSRARSVGPARDALAAPSWAASATRSASTDWW